VQLFKDLIFILIFFVIMNQILNYIGKHFNIVEFLCNLIDYVRVNLSKNSKKDK